MALVAALAVIISAAMVVRVACCQYENIVLVRSVCGHIIERDRRNGWSCSFEASFLSAHYWIKQQSNVPVQLQILTKREASPLPPSLSASTQSAISIPGHLFKPQALCLFPPPSLPFLSFPFVSFLSLEKARGEVELPRNQDRQLGGTEEGDVSEQRRELRGSDEGVNPSLTVALALALVRSCHHR